MSTPESPIEEHEILDLLTALVDKSLVAYDESAGRFDLLETVRQYARDRLVDSGGGASWRDRHLARFIELAEEAEPHLTGAIAAEWLDRLEADHDNIRAALEWTSCRGVPASVRLAGSLWRFWEIRGYLSEGRLHLRSAIQSGTGGASAAEQARALTGAGLLALDQGDYDEAASFFEECLALYRGLKDRHGESASLNNLGIAAANQGQHERALRLHEASLAIRRELGNARLIAMSLNNLGALSSEQADYRQAIVYLEESLAISQRLRNLRSVAKSLNNLGIALSFLGDHEGALERLDAAISAWAEVGDSVGTARCLANIANVRIEQGDCQAARPLIRQSLEIAREIGDRALIVTCVDESALVTAAGGMIERAVTLWGAADCLRSKIGRPRIAGDHERYVRGNISARAAMGKPSYVKCIAAGRAMTMDEAIELALEDSTLGPPQRAT